jgi:hypothetical protein
MATNLVSVANVAGKNDIVFTSVATIAFPISGIIVQVIPSKIVGSTTCVTQITLVATGDVYYTSTTVTSLYTSSVYTGTAKYSFTATVAAKNGFALASAAATGFPSLGVMLETISSTTYGSTVCVTKITLLATNDVYFCSESVATLVSRT